MLISEEVEVELAGMGYKYFGKLGYNIPKVKDKKGRMSTPQGTKILVKVNDLPKGSHVEVEVLCDYCLEKGIETISVRKWQDHINSKKNSPTNKDCCGNHDCINKKREETMLFRYGKKSSMQIEEFKLKQFNTNINKYGFKNPLQREEIKEKVKQTRIEKYGVEHMLQLPECMEKLKATTKERHGEDFYTQTEEYKVKTIKTNNDKYGCDNPLQNEDIREKVRKTNLKRYGFEYAQQNPEIKMKSITTLYKNNNQKASNQQKYIQKLLINSELNHLVSRMFLDIAFIEEKIYIEYDGGFHNGSVIMGNISQVDFDKKEFKRSCYLRDLGWKEIRIISISDLIPSDEVIINMINYAKEYFNTGHRWINFDIDNGKIICSQGKLDFDYGDLRKIKGTDLEEVG